MWRIKVLTHLKTSKEINKQKEHIALHVWESYEIKTHSQLCCFVSSTLSQPRFFETNKIIEAPRFSGLIGVTSYITTEFAFSTRKVSHELDYDSETFQIKVNTSSKSLTQNVMVCSNCNPIPEPTPGWSNYMRMSNGALRCKTVLILWRGV